MSLAGDLDALFSAGFDQLYPLYGDIIDIIELGSGFPELLLPGSAEDLETDIQALIFPLSKYEKELYGTGFGEDTLKFVFETTVPLNTEYMIRKDTDIYEIFNIVNRSAFGRYRVIAKRSEDV